MTQTQTQYLLWYDRDPQSTLAAKLAEAAHAYTVKHDRVPTVALVPLGTVLPDVPGLQIRESRICHSNYVYVGEEHGL